MTSDAVTRFLNEMHGEAITGMTDADLWRFESALHYVHRAVFAEMQRRHRQPATLADEVGSIPGVRLIMSTSTKV
jgi:hypothetical protein